MVFDNFCVGRVYTNTRDSLVSRRPARTTFN